MDGFHVSCEPDMFRLVDRVRNLYKSIKRIGKKERLKVTIKEKSYPVLGTLGMYHMEIDITGSDCKVGDTVVLQVNPLYVDRLVGREYR